MTLIELSERGAELRRKHPDAILLMRDGDCYYVVGDDAKKASEILSKTLSRDDDTGIYSCRIEREELDTTLPKLVRAGERMAICEQVALPEDINQRLSGFKTSCVNEMKRRIIKECEQSGSAKRLRERYEHHLRKYTQSLDMVDIVGWARGRLRLYQALTKNDQPNFQY